MISMMHAIETAGMAAAARPCGWRSRGMGQVGGSYRGITASLPIQHTPTFHDAPNATKRSPRRLAERLT